MGNSCLGLLPRERGERRVPEPPAMMTPYSMELSVGWRLISMFDPGVGGSLVRRRPLGLYRIDSIPAGGEKRVVTLGCRVAWACTHARALPKKRTGMSTCPCHPEYYRSCGPSTTFPGMRKVTGFIVILVAGVGRLALAQP